MRKDRFIVGIICIALAVWLFLSGVSGGIIAPVIAILILGIIMIAISRRGEYADSKIKWQRLDLNPPELVATKEEAASF